MAAVGIGLQLSPLLRELELHVFLEFGFKVELAVVIINSKIPVHADILRPFHPGLALEEIVKRHEKSIVI